MNPKKVITRFPPSPTGLLHIGGVRTALFNYLFAAHNDGTMYLRFEDTDKERSRKEFEEDILNALHWVGIPYTPAAQLRQSEKLDVYKKHLTTLIEQGVAYEAEEAENNPDKKVVRFKNQNKTITFNDLVRGEVAFDTTDLGDFVIARSVDESLYHLAVVIDDAESGVTHVIRGEEHISNTPRQILIIEALGFERPQYAHIPLILAPDKSKLSKRHGAVSANEYRKDGYIPEALVNYLALLGWNPGGEQEIFTLDELVKLFTLDRVHKAGAVFDLEKFTWFNHEHLKLLSDEEYARRFTEFSGKELEPKLIPLIKARAQTLKEAVELAEEEFNLTNYAAPDQALLLKGSRTDAEIAQKHLRHIVKELEKVHEEKFNSDTVKSAIFDYATEQGRAGVLWPMRVALSGKDTSPDPFTLAGLLGKETTLSRIEQALKKL